MSISSIAQGNVGGAKAAGATSQLANDYESFLKLLVAQIQNQDPLAPMESTEFVSQLAQLTQVEQSVQVNTHMESLRQQLAMNAALSETGLIGRDVTVTSENFDANPEVGEGRFWYKLASEAQSVQAQIRDMSGNLVATIDGLSGNAGEMIEVRWDGMNKAGEMAAAGRYRIDIAAVGLEGNSTAYDTFAISKVVAVDYSQGTTSLQLASGATVSTGDVVRAE